MIFPRTRTAQRRYQRNKLIAIVITFVVGWIAFRVLPGDVLPARWKPSAPPTPEAAFRDRASGIVVECAAVVEATLPDSAGAATALVLRRWRMRSGAGHPFVLLTEPGLTPSPAPGETLLVRGTYRWETTGGTVRTGS